MVMYGMCRVMRLHMYVWKKKEKYINSKITRRQQNATETKSSTP